jgi:putative inorganic carbon (hco3(-)) transporter
VRGLSIVSRPFVRYPHPSATTLLLGGALLAGLGVVAGPIGPLVASLVGLALLLATGWLARQRPDLLVPLIVATTPLEITRIWIPILKAPTDWFGYDVSLLDAGRLAMLLAAAIWVIRAAPSGRLAFPRDQLFVWASILVLVPTVSLLYTLDPSRGRNEVIRLLFNWLLMVMVATYLPTSARVQVAARSWVLVGVVLAVVALGQYATGIAFWNPKLQEQEFRRINSTFADPNTFASFLNVGAAFALSYLAARRTRFSLWLAALALLGSGLLVTFSRSGWLAFGLMVVLWGLAFARTPRSGLLFVLALCSGVLLVLAAPSALDRLQNLTGAEALSYRPYLIDVGLLIFREHPLTGIGIGSFQLAVTTSYAYAYPFFYYISASHTSLVTTAAEQGIAGLVATLGVLVTVGAQVYLLAVDRRLPAASRAIARALLMALFVLVIAGQTTGALFEEPYVWIVFGLAIALRRAALSERSAPL